jgi:hypothetical protein
MQEAFALGLLRNDHGMAVFISEGLWRRMSFAEKLEFTYALNCAVAGVGKGLGSLRFRSDMTGHTIGEWNMGTLTVAR